MSDLVYDCDAGNRQSVLEISSNEQIDPSAGDVFVKLAKVMIPESSLCYQLVVLRGRLD
jgi:hypothetical protein